MCVCVCAGGHSGARRPWVCILTLKFYYCVALTNLTSFPHSFSNCNSETMIPITVLWETNLPYVFSAFVMSRD